MRCATTGRSRRPTGAASAAPRCRRGTDSYWFADYQGDLDGLLDALSPGAPVDLAGHSMGGNVVMTYAGARPERIRRLINMEGFGLPESKPEQAPERLRQWLDELKTPHRLKPYASLADVAARLIKNNPRLSRERATWLAAHWSERRDDGQWHVLGDPAHKRVNPSLYRKDEILEGWKRISAPTLWLEGDETDPDRWWGHRYPRSEFEARLGARAQPAARAAESMRPHAALRPAASAGRGDRALCRSAGLDQSGSGGASISCRMRSSRRGTSRGPLMK